MPLSPSNALLLSIADTTFPSSGTIAQLILLSGDTYTGTVTATAASNQISSVSPHGLLAGVKVRLSSTGTVPTPTAVATDYYVSVVSSTVIKLHGTLVDAIGGTNEIDLTDAGSGTITLIEQQPDNLSPLPVLLGKELAGPVYSRQPIAAIGAATIGLGGQANKPDKTVTLTNGGATALTYRHQLIALGAGASGSSGITGFLIQSETTDQQIAAGQSRQFLIKLFAEKP